MQVFTPKGEADESEGGTRSNRRPVNARVPFGVTLINVLEHGRALLLVTVGRVGAGQTGVEHVFDGELEMGPRGGFLPPVGDLRRGFLISNGGD